ncbi:hypothetical protein COY87_01025 [Candidatus Roizmanbacteria bacterium CG_4_10_14_0_8_um_filter_33_9]|uniref:Glycosyltransferase RgtA/B/C/D-like domain-containing protein n=1 Tax=Candidatus Roizmanbacteria bacterium CG_4_10_14_0_8_um_filter_33_9 TaxID=1974826 RepID=A0A2M7QKH1_9BACT|nr:MAG: hypothetical protein COY87_01025 [Candidatus Roizmanbacteria bacterium CG_4_10_14_0_8_um_filter_33_9]
MVYFLCLEIFNFIKIKDKNKLALLVAGLVAISPWSIQLSRVAYEANLAAMFNLASLLFLFKARKNFKFFLPTVIFACLAVYTFNSFRIFTPFIFLAGFLFIFKPGQMFYLLKKNILIFLTAFLIGAGFAIPLYKHVNSPEGKLRFTEVNIFNNLEIVERSNQLVAEYGNTVWSKIIYNRRWGYTKLFLSHFFDHFNFRFLFLEGDVNPRINSGQGQLYWLEAPLILFGLYALFKKKKLLFFLAVWLVLGVLPAAMARETPHALRTVGTLPIWQIFIAFGIYQIFLFGKKAKPALFLLIVLYVFSLYGFLYNYFVVYPLKSADSWFNAFDQAVEFAFKNQNQYKKEYIQLEDRAYIAYLFYNKIEPEYFQKADKDYPDRSLLAGNAYVVKKMDQVDFYIPDNLSSGSLLIGKPEHIPPQAEVVKQFKDITGKVAFEAAKL